MGVVNDFFYQRLIVMPSIKDYLDKFHQAQ